MKHYLDNSATTPVCEEAREAVNLALDSYGNPSSLHSVGFEAEKLVSKARTSVLRAICGTEKFVPEQLFFTSGGTEANNIAIIGTALAKERNRGKRIIIGESEHPSVIEPAKKLAELGFDVVFVPCRRGVFDMEKYRAALSANVILVSLMLVNNETGAVYDIPAVSAAARSVSPGVIVHCDAVQGFMKLPLPLAHADMLTVSSHKINGPKGAGALYVSRDVLKTRALSPTVFGGGQERGIRSGTENVPGIAGFGAAAEARYGKMPALTKKYAALYAQLEEELSAFGGYGVRINKPAGAFASHIINITVPGVRAETMLHFLSEYDVFVSSGSACSSNTGHVSHVLLSYGLSEEEARCSVRVSLGVQTESGDISAFSEALGKGLERLVKKSGRGDAR